MYRLNRNIKQKLSSLFKLTFLIAMCLLLFSGCKKLYNLPDEKEYLSGKIDYSNKIIEPVIGRWNLHGGINIDNSSLPLKFEIVNARYGDGRPVTDIFQVRPTYVWIAAYDGLETSLEEIEAKRKIEDHPIFEVRESGEFILWPSATNELLEPRPSDSSNLAQDTRFFDLKISNTGGEIILKDFQLRPWREREYYPDNDINHYTGEVRRDPRDPFNPNRRDYIRPWLDNVIGANTLKSLVSNDDKKDAVVYIRRFEGGNGHNLRFKVLDTDSVPMNPALFNETKWEEMVHGFNMEITDEYVQYDVAYPIPLVSALNTKYASGGNAHANIRYSRRGFGGDLTTGAFGVDFRIYRPGDWEIVFHFKNDNPKFEDE
ncbi:DUF5007 domain-containing protein [Albibacterium indicum]|uniref:DUF5007 domain-containing protein n=1 Tax=Albibacterium indicum TaxID=2292082 RepID=UPI000E53652C|nr:DUF5007 domain-containing protein [Pedobacter indicus]